jgi:transposase
MKALAVLLYTVGNASFGMISRMLGVSNVAVMKWIKKEAESLPEPSVSKDSTLLQVDEMWHFVNGKKTKFGSGKPMIAIQGEWSPGNWVGVMLER